MPVSVTNGVAHGILLLFLLAAGCGGSGGECTADCGDRVCGPVPNGCGESCGSCGIEAQCSAEGQCVACATAGCGLTWQEPPESTFRDWDRAIAYCEGLTLDGSSDWRLPSVSELRTLLRNCPATESGGACGVIDTCLAGSCASGDCTPACDGAAGTCLRDVALTGSCGWTWSASAVDGDSSEAWRVDFETGQVSNFAKTSGIPVRCVR
jgi:hypothetical protein